MMAGDPKTVLEFAEHAAEGGWGEASVLARRYIAMNKALDEALAIAQSMANEREHWASSRQLAERRIEAMREEWMLP